MYSILLKQIIKLAQLFLMQQDKLFIKKNSEVNFINQRFKKLTRFQRKSPAPTRILGLTIPKFQVLKLTSISASAKNCIGYILKAVPTVR